MSGPSLAASRVCAAGDLPFCSGVQPAGPVSPGTSRCPDVAAHQALAPPPFLQGSQGLWVWLSRGGPCRALTTSVGSTPLLPSLLLAVSSLVSWPSLTVGPLWSELGLLSQGLHVCSGPGPEKGTKISVLVTGVRERMYPMGTSLRNGLEGSDLCS